MSEPRPGAPEPLTALESSPPNRVHNYAAWDGESCSSGVHHDSHVDKVVIEGFMTSPSCMDCAVIER